MPNKEFPKSGASVLLNPKLNKGTAFTIEERKKYDIQGLIPPIVETIDDQLARVNQHLSEKRTDLGRYVYLTSLLGRNETLFYKTLMSDPKRFIPIMYDPTVGEACERFSEIYRYANGMYISLKDKGQVKNIIKNWAVKDVRFICVSTGGRILGLGDLGANGMGIPLGKLQLYTACAAIPPENLMPLLLDFGTDNETLLNDPFYIGLKQHRPSDAIVDEFVQEFVEAVQEVYPDCCIHFEDWKGTDAIRLLAKYKDKISCYNDDIQGTGAVAVAGLMGAINLKNSKVSKEKALFFGAGSAGVGIANMVSEAMQLEGLSEEEALKNIFMFDINGLLTTTRTDLSKEQRKFAHNLADTKDLVTAIKTIQPTMLIGVSTKAKAFTKDVFEAMLSYCDRPIVFALSNPTTKAECSAEEAYTWTNGKAIFAAGVPFDEVVVDGKTFYPGQANNFYCFPGVSLAIFATKPKKVTDDAWIESAKALASILSDKQRAEGLIFPPQSDIIATSTKVAVHVADYLFKAGLAKVERPADLEKWITSLQYQPVYNENL